MMPVSRSNPLQIEPYLYFNGRCEEALTFYQQALGARTVALNRFGDNPDVPAPLGAASKIMHAELKIGDSRIMMNDAMMGGRGPKAIGGSPASLWLYVEDCDSLFNRAITAGGQISQGGMGKMQDQFWGDRSGTFTDPHGYTWTIATHKEDFTPEEMKKRSEEFMKQFAAQGSR